MTVPHASTLPVDHVTRMYFAGALYARCQGDVRKSQTRVNRIRNGAHVEAGDLLACQNHALRIAELAKAAATYAELLTTYLDDEAARLTEADAL